jgi:hypothetical protein
MFIASLLCLSVMVDIGEAENIPAEKFSLKFVLI